MGVEAHRLLYQPDGFLGPPRKVQNSPQLRIAFSTVGIEGNGPLCLGDGLVMLLFPQIDKAQYPVGQGQRVIQGDRLLRQHKARSRVWGS